MNKPEKTIAKLRANGLKITPQRRVILEILGDDRSHPNANQVYQRACEIMPDISRTTVYNTLNELIELGELSEVTEMGEDGLRYDTNTENHHHLFCVDCHALIDVHRDFSELDISEDEANGYQIFKRQVTFYGRCPECIQRSQS